jgi:hypothetical protein
MRVLLGLALLMTAPAVALEPSTCGCDPSDGEACLAEAWSVPSELEAVLDGCEADPSGICADEAALFELALLSPPACLPTDYAAVLAAAGPSTPAGVGLGLLIRIKKSLPLGYDDCLQRPLPVKGSSRWLECFAVGLVGDTEDGGAPGAPAGLPTGGPEWVGGE